MKILKLISHRCLTCILKTTLGEREGPGKGCIYSFGVCVQTQSQQELKGLIGVCVLVRTTAEYIVQLHPTWGNHHQSKSVILSYFWLTRQVSALVQDVGKNRTTLSQRKQLYLLMYSRKANTAFKYQVVNILIKVIPQDRLLRCF